MSEVRTAAGALGAVFDAIVEVAVAGTDATRGALLVDGPDALVVVAVAGDAPDEAVGRAVPGAPGTAGYVVASAQPMALSARAGDQPLDASLGSAASMLCVPCTYADAVVGAIELTDKVGGHAFDYEDLEFATLLSAIAAAALAAAMP